MQNARIFLPNQRVPAKTDEFERKRPSLYICCVFSISYAARRWLVMLLLEAFMGRVIPVFLDRPP
jgi:hypothetical protein